MGTGETLGRGAIQFMTAASGVTHSEHNHDQKSFALHPDLVEPSLQEPEAQLRVVHQQARRQAK